MSEAATAGRVGYRPARADPDATPFRARDVSRAVPAGPWFADADLDEARAAAALAAAAFRDVQLGAAPIDATGVGALVADRLSAHADAITALAALETGLPEALLRAELDRTTGQLRRLAAVAARRSGTSSAHDRADDTVAPRAPDLLLGHVPVGPVAVFGSSNFPLAFSAAGGDTAAALAAGCPVIVKAHPAHPGTDALVAGLAADAARDAGLPEGWVSVLHGAGTAIGLALVRAPGVAAVGFTGSRAGGEALGAAAAGRPDPIPVFAEMGGLNPVVVLPGAAQRSAPEARELAASVLVRSGQMCTRPSVLLIVDDAGARALVDALAEELSAGGVPPLLTPAIDTAFRASAARRRALPGARVPLAGPGDGAPIEPLLTVADAATLRGEPQLREEVFGPALLVVCCTDIDELLAVVEELPGCLTATLHAGAGDDPAPVLRRLRLIAGRVLFAGMPTGVRVGAAMQHGGPRPATSAPATTSVGEAAIDRFLRPVAYQDAPEALRAAALTWS